MKKHLLLFIALFLMVATGARADDKSINTTSGGSNEWTFTMPEKDVVLAITYTDGTTAVIEIKDKKVKKVTWYDLSGRKLPAEPKKSGIYIKDGKAVVVKK